MNQKHLYTSTCNSILRGKNLQPKIRKLCKLGFTLCKRDWRGRHALLSAKALRIFNFTIICVDMLALGILLLLLNMPIPAGFILSVLSGIIATHVNRYLTKMDQERPEKEEKSSDN